MSEGVGIQALRSEDGGTEGWLDSHVVWWMDGVMD